MNSHYVIAMLLKKLVDLSKFLTLKFNFLFMKSFFILSFYVFGSCQILFGQIGHTTITFNDPVRTGGFGSGGGAGRQIQTEIYYPAATTGDDVPVLNNTYPVIVFGHGFVMSWDAYANIWEHYVALGYILAFPRTEGGISPNHNEFGLDLKIVETKLQALNADATSLFNNKLLPNSAIMGHSMGGGATILAGANNSTIKAIVGMAPAETNPSAIAAATSVTVPSLIFSGSGDGVTPPADHHIPIYNALTSSCKSFVNIIGGGHCYFANSSTTCDFGELTSISSVTINRTTQHTRTFSILDPFLDYHLKGNCSSKAQFLNLMASSPTGFANQTSCLANPIPTIIQSGSVLSSAIVGQSYQWLLNGNAIVSATASSYTFTQNGQYTLEVTFADGCSEISNQITINSASINSLESKAISIYPNPTLGIVNLVFETQDNFEVEVYTITGEKLTSASNQFTVDLTSFPAGIYFLRIDGNNFPIIKN